MSTERFMRNINGEGIKNATDATGMSLKDVRSMPNNVELHSHHSSVSREGRGGGSEMLRPKFDTSIAERLLSKCYEFENVRQQILVS